MNDTKDVKQFILIKKNKLKPGREAEEAVKDIHSDVFEKTEEANHKAAAELGISYEEFMHRKIKEKHGERIGQQIIDVIEKRK